MSELIELNEKPRQPGVTLIAGWRQWADAGSTSSSLPAYLVERIGAHRIGSIRSENFYLFQFPGTHDLIRPVVKFDDGYPKSLVTPRNDLFYAPDTHPDVVFFLGDEPHMNIEAYVAAFFQLVGHLEARRVIGIGGVYGELPYDKERSISCIYSLPRLRNELQDMAVNFSDYHGGASIDSVLCKRAGEKGLEFISFYAFVPAYDFSNVTNINSRVQIENDFMAWLAVMRRINFLQKTSFDLSDLEQKGIQLVQTVNEKMDELDRVAPQLGIRDYLARLAEDYKVTPFNPIDEFWESKLRKILDQDLSQDYLDGEEDQGEPNLDPPED